MKQINNKTKLNTLLIATPLLGIITIGLCIAQLANPQLTEWIYFGTGLLVLFVAAITAQLFIYKSGSNARTKALNENGDLVRRNIKSAYLLQWSNHSNYYL